jgi:benzoyl-CoA reductase/2-hydroxyglutaryl-CoA dehydratase subunit BcrC/BadD/HgdB
LGLVDDPARVYYIGMAPQDLRFWNMIEDCGGVLVGCDTYLPLFHDLIPENGPVLGNFAKWIWMMPHHLLGLTRAKMLTKYIKQQKPDAIIIGNVIGCRNLSSTDRIMKETLKEEWEIPITSIEFGSSDEDVALLEPHIKAFIEMCR